MSPASYTRNGPEVPAKKWITSLMVVQDDPQPAASASSPAEDETE